MDKSFGLYLVLTRPLAGYELCTEAAVTNHVRYVQLRMKDAPREDVLRTATRLRDITRHTCTRLIINDDVDVAAAIKADGIHLGQADMPIKEARRVWTSEGAKVFGQSTHDEAQAQAAVATAPDYIGVGPLFPTPTKRQPDPLLGLERGARIARSSRLVCVGIGGIDATTLPLVLDAGFENFAVVRHVCASSRPAERIGELMAMWRAATKAPRTTRAHGK